MRNVPQFVLAAFVVILTTGFAAPAFQDAPEKPLRFEVASVKLNPSLSLRHVLLPPVGERLSTRNASLGLLILSAYSVQAFQVLGGPKWMNSAGYDIEAKAEGNATRAEIWLMLRTLLEDRFKLKVHRETREMPVYALRSAKSGIKLKASEVGGCQESALSGAGASPLGPCGELSVGAERAGLFVRGREVSIAQLTKTLSAILDHPVIDKTRITSKFDVDLNFAYDDLTVGLPKPPAGGENLTSIVGALQQQLGVKLESAKGPVEVLVIDRAERPSEN